MPNPADRCLAESALFQFITRGLRDFVAPVDMLVRFDQQFNFANLIAPRGDLCCPATVAPLSTRK